MKTITIKILAANQKRFLAEAPYEFFMLLDLPIELINGTFNFNKEYNILIQESLLHDSIIW